MTQTPEKRLRTFEGAVAIVTGGASGIGRALGEELAGRGAAVTLADLQIDLAREVAAEIRSRGQEAAAAELDVRSYQAFDDLVQATAASAGRLDYLFNNAGIGIGGEAHLYALEDWYQVFDVNLRGVAHGVQAAYPLMLAQGFGHLVNTASMAGLIPQPGLVSYSATKHAVVGLSKSLRIEAAASGVRISALCPGVVRTPILDDGGVYGKMLTPIPPELERKMRRQMHPMEPRRFACKVLRAVARNRAIIIVPAWWKLFWWLDRLSPSLSLFLARRLHEHWRRELERAAAAGTSKGGTSVQGT